MQTRIEGNKQGDAENTADFKYEGWNVFYHLRT
jgi:hypothetical protein